MTSFSWLHLTDLHMGMTEQLPFLPVIKDRFFDDLEVLHKKCGSWDLVLFTGDLTQGGKVEEFKKVDEFLAELWEHLGKLGSKPSLLAVPGNHDLTRPINPKEPEVVVLRSWALHPDVQPEFWTDSKSRYRKVVDAAFENYINWWNSAPSRLPIQSGMLPGDFSAVLEKPGASLGIVGLNTTFLQLTPGDYKGKLTLDARQFQEACGSDGPEWVKKRSACLLLTHQPPDWLTLEAQKQLQAEITGYDYFAAHIFGHMHEARYSAAAEGGASLRRTSQGPSLFGMEYFGEEKKQERIHGYVAGKIEIDGAKGRLQFWPRRAFRPGGEWNFAADTETFKLTEEHTRPEEIPIRIAAETSKPEVSSPLALAGSDIERPFPNQWAVLIGVNDYQHFTKLQYCRQDVVDLALALRGSLGFRNVFEFHEESELKAEREAIFQKLADLRDSREVKPDDLFVFYFSGHGMNVDSKDYLLPIGARPRDVKNLGIPIQGLVESLKDIGCKNTAMFIDACREAQPGTKGTVSIGEDSREVALEAGIVAFFSCDPRDRSYEIEPLKHGSFTYCILQAIQDGTITTVAELDGYLKEKVPQINVSYRKPAQQPYVVTAGREALKILFCPQRAGQAARKFGLFIDRLTVLAEGEITRDDFVKAVEFLAHIRSKSKLDANETTRLWAIEGLCEGRWEADVFRRIWTNLESRRLGTPQIKKDLSPLR
jgi:hypothetical protein